jgi:DNA-binding beta-propeller fold protein YncE/ABC-type spermidine/putrescine transport system permease subunit II
MPTSGRPRASTPEARRGSCTSRFGVCLTFTLGEFAAFSLAGIKTVGTELAVLFDRTGSPETVARAAWPLTLIALVVALLLWRKSQDWSLQPAAGIESEGSSKTNRWRWLVVATLVCVSLVVPVGLLVLALRDLSPFANFWSLQRDGLLFGQTSSPPWFDLSCPGSMPISAVAALLAMAVCLPTFFLRARWLEAVLYVTIFAAALLPGSVIAAAVFKACGVLGCPELRQSWGIVSVGLAARFAGILLIVLHLTRSREDRHLAELAAVDGAGAYQAWRWVHLPRHWTLALGGLVLVWMLGLTEVAVTSILLPPGVPNFAQRLLDQMHFARQQQAVASCLIVVGIYVALAVLASVILRLFRSPTPRRTLRTFLVICVALTLLPGCQKRPTGEVNVVAVIGNNTGGRGPGEFIYPRAIDLTADGRIVAVDKTGRVQVLTIQGQCELTIQMPLTEQGRPTGVTVGPDGNIYVADTHYNRVMVFDRQGKLVRQWGKFGTGPGEFIYPTDVAFAPDGRVFVSEYGGNDRVSIFNAAGKFLGSFGSFGPDRGQFQRPAAICVDANRSRLYVADACNHRLAVYNLDGTLETYIGSIGAGPGQLRYPYSVALMPDGSLLVCEFGNNRLQTLSPDGASLGTFGTAGRDKGQLAFPWAAAVDSSRRVYIVDSGNNRLQVWQL